MAGDWIKVECTTPDKPEVFQIAERLDLAPEHVFGCLVALWIWADEQTIDGNAAGVTRALLQRKTGVAGFADAMIEVGWLEEGEGGLSFPNFERHNGKTAKNRALTAKRAAKHRAGSNADSNADRNGAGVTSASPREEKRREEKGKENPSVDSGESTQMAITESDQQPAPEDKPVSRFEEWWQQYPKKVAKKAAQAKWKAKRLDAKADELIADVCKRKEQDREWLDGYIPYPTKYLAQERWNDEIEQPQGARNGRHEQGRAARFANRIDELASGAAGPALDGGDFQDASGPVRRTLDVEPGGDRGARTLRVVEGAGRYEA